MATAIIMPRQGQSVESCLFGEWKKAVGDTVEIGDVLFSYETDKATFEEEAKVAGTLLGKEGTAVRLALEDGTEALLDTKLVSDFRLCDDEDLF